MLKWWRERKARWRRRHARFVVFFLELPDPLPFPDGWICTFALDEQVEALEGLAQQSTPGDPPLPFEPGSSFVSLRFWRTDVTTPGRFFDWDPVDQAIRRALPSQLHLADAETEAAPPGAYVTVVEAVTPVDLRKGEAGISDAFDSCLQKLSDLVAAYRMQSYHPVRQITRQRLPALALHAMRTLDEPPKWGDGMSVMLLHANLPAGLDELSMDELREVATHLSVSMRGHPLILAAGHSVESRVALERDGDYGEAVVQVQTAGEILLDGLLTLMLWEEGTSPEDGAKCFEEGLTKRLRTHYASRLGGDWNLKTSPALLHWQSNVAYVRGRVVHAGYRPTLDEAREAQEAGKALLAFLKDRVAARRNRYPRTALLTLGRPGLERLGLWSGAIRRFAERADEEPDWLATFGKWRERLERARNSP